MLDAPDCLGRSERGTTIVETALTIGVFLFCLGAGLELMRLGYYSVTYQMLAARAARCGGVSDCGVPADQTGSIRARELVRQLATDTGAPGPLAAPFGVSIDQSNVCAWVVTPASPGPAAGQPCQAVRDIGDPYDPQSKLFLVRIQRDLPLFFGLGHFTVTAQALGYNEPPAL